MVTVQLRRRPATDALAVCCGAVLAACGSTPPVDPSPPSRIAWVEAADDLEAVGWAARHDPSRHVRRAAVERLRDQDVLWEVATSDPVGAVRRQAITQLTDARRVARIAITAAWWQDRAAAVAVTEDRALLHEVATGDPDPEVRREALSRLPPLEIRVLALEGDGHTRVEALRALDPTDPTLDRLARDIDPAVREATVERIADTEELRRALDDRDPSIRRAAVRRVEDADRLRRIARSDEDPGVRTAAVRRLDDSRTLVELVQTDDDDRVRAVAASRLTEQAALVHIARTDRAPGVRAAAAVRLDDPATLLELATDDPAPEVRSAAVRRITDQGALRNLAGHESDARVRHEIALRVADPVVLASLTGADAPLATRLVAADRLDGPLLAQLALHDPSWYVRWSAVERLDDIRTLDRLAQDSHREVRERAVWRRGAPECGSVLIACPRLEPARVRGERWSVTDRRPLRNALTDALSGLPISRVEMEWAMEDTPYVAPEEDVRATVWVERVEARFVVGDVALSMTATGTRAGRVVDLADLVPGADGRIVDQRPAEVDAVAWIAELLARFDGLPEPGDPDGLLAPAVELEHWRRATEAGP